MYLCFYALNRQKGKNGVLLLLLLLLYYITIKEYFTPKLLGLKLNNMQSISLNFSKSFCGYFAKKLSRISRMNIDLLLFFEKSLVNIFFSNFPEEFPEECLFNLVNPFQSTF